MIDFKIIQPQATMELLGLLPSFFSESDPRPAKDQINERYAHGGGWHPMKKWKRTNETTLQYPGDRPIKPMAVGRLREERIFLYPYSWVMILQPNGDFEVSRVD